MDETKSTLGDEKFMKETTLNIVLGVLWYSNVVAATFSNDTSYE